MDQLFCFKKFVSAKKFYNVDYLILGGDLIGKKIAIIRKDTRSNFYLNNKIIANSKNDLKSIIKKYERQGTYYSVSKYKYEDYSNIEIKELFAMLAFNRLNQWIEIAQEKLPNHMRIIAITGNDDLFEMDDILDKSDVFRLANNKIVSIEDKFNMLGYSFSTPTPWNTQREKKR